MLYCDPGFTQGVDSLSLSNLNLVVFTDYEPWVYLAMTCEGPGPCETTLVNVDQMPMGTYHWTYKVVPEAAGSYVLRFFKDTDDAPGIELGWCEVEAVL